MNKKPTAEQRVILHRKHLTKKFAGKNDADLLDEFRQLDSYRKKPMRKRHLRQELENRGFRIKLFYRLEKTEPPPRK